MLDGGYTPRRRCCRCGSEKDLVDCMECERPVCQRCRAGFRSASEYWCLQDCLDTARMTPPDEEGETRSSPMQLLILLFGATAFVVVVSILWGSP